LIYLSPFNVKAKETEHEKKREAQVPPDHEALQRQKEKVMKLKQETEEAKWEKMSAEDKLATTLYNLKANEKDLAKNVVASLETLKDFFKQSLDSLTNDLPALAKRVEDSAQTRVYGVDLGTHLRIDGNV